MSKSKKNKKTLAKRAKIFQIITYWPTYLALKWLVDYKVYGQKNLRGLEKGPIIFASNHASYLDGPICAAAMPRDKGEWHPKGFFPIRFLALARFFKWRYLIVAAYVRLNSSIRIWPKSGSLGKVLREAVSALKEDGHIWIYPEGKRSRDGRLHQGRRGVAYLHQATGAPIVPVGIKGNYELLSSKCFFRPTKIRIYVGRPIYSLGNVSIEKGADMVMEEIGKLLNQPVIKDIKKSS